MTVTAELPTFATLADLDLRLPGGLRDADRARAWATLLDASALVRTVVGSDYVDDSNVLTGVPPIFASVVCASARRALDNPDGIQEEALGSYRAVLSNASGDVYLTAAETKNVRRAAGFTGLWTLPTTRDPANLGPEMASVLPWGVNSEEFQFIGVDPPGEVLPNLDPTW